MILDDLARAATYYPLNSRLRAALEFLQTADLAALPVGRHAIDGDDIFVLVQSYDTKAEHETRWEAHRRHIDVQYVVSGEELIGVAPLPALTTEPYDADKDILFASGHGEFVRLTPGRFIVLFPQDGHMPGVHASQPTAVRKLVIKFRIDP